MQGTPVLEEKFYPSCAPKDTVKHVIIKVDSSQQYMGIVLLLVDVLIV